MPSITDWFAKLIDGKEMTRQGSKSFLDVPQGRIEMMKVSIDHPGMPHVGVKVTPGVGVRLFTRRTFKGFEADESIPVIEIVPDPGVPAIYVRVYLHADGPIISDQDLNF